MPERTVTSHPNSAPGDFYVEYECCTSCGVPQVVAPDLIAPTDAADGHCYWRKQPETNAELKQAIKVLATQELGCHRYAGSDPAILSRISPELCDYPLPKATQGLSAKPHLERSANFTLAENKSLLVRLWRRITGKDVR